VALGVGAVALWVVGISEFSGGARPAEAFYLWDVDSAAIVFGMAIIGSFGAFVAGGLAGLAWPWRVLGVLALAPFACMIAVFPLLSAGGGTCPTDGGPCSASALLRFGGLMVTLGACAAAAIAARAISARAHRA
jgi:hypothetical protein